MPAAGGCAGHLLLPAGHPGRGGGRGGGPGVGAAGQGVSGLAPAEEKVPQQASVLQHCLQAAQILPLW